MQKLIEEARRDQQGPQGAWMSNADMPRTVTARLGKDGRTRQPEAAALTTSGSPELVNQCQTNRDHEVEI